MTSKLNLLSLDKYDMEAVVAPAMLSLILIIPSVEVFIDFALVKDVFREIPSTVLAVVAMLIVFVVWRNIVRIVSKSIFEPIMFGRNSERLPTTLFLLKENSDGDNLLVEKVREKIKADFGITLKSVTTECQNPLQASSCIASAVKLVKKSVQNNNPEMYKRRNIRYGFWRNMIGGCLISFGVNIVLMVIAYINSYSVYLELTCLLCALALGIFSYICCNKAAKDYANELFETYLTL